MKQSSPDKQGMSAATYPFPNFLICS